MAVASSSAFWLLAGTFLVLLIAGGIRASFGVFIHPLEEAFASDRAQVALVASVALLVFGVIQPLAGSAIDRRGPGRLVPAAILIAALGSLAASSAGALWQVGLLYGIVASVGFGAISNAPLSGLVARHYTSRRGLALGLCSAGTPLGQLVLAPTLALVIVEHGWRAAMGWMGIILALILLPVAWLLLRREPASQTSAPQPPFHGLRWALTTRPYQLLIGAYVICGMTTLGIVHTHLVPYALDLGIPQVEGARVLGVVGLANVAGLLLAGHAADRWGARLPLATVYGCRSLALLWLALAADQSMLLAFAIVFGLTDMATIPLTASQTASLFGRQTVGALFGLAAVGHQVGSAVGAWLAGLGYTLLGSYQPIILAGAVLATLASFMAASLERRPEPHPATRSL